MNLTAFTREFIQSRDLSHPDGRPLYEYRCSDEEFERLTQAANDEGMHHLKEPKGAAGFCLFVSEWWRRHYDGGPWAWDPILEEAGLASLSRPDCYAAVERGLKFWQRRLLRTGAQRAFLATLACEGGLPLKMLRQEGAGLQRYFRAVLQAFHEYGHSGASATRLAEMESRHLPRSFRQDVVFTLTGKICREVWELQPRIETVDNPVGYLDRSDPEWRKRIPLRIEDETAGALLNNLVGEVKRIAQVKRADFKAVRCLIKDDSNWYLEVELRIPPKINFRQMQDIFGTEAIDLPNRFEIISDGDEDNRVLALATQVGSGDEREYFIETLSGADRTRKGSIGASGWGLIATSRKISIGPVEPQGAGALSELPWLFVDKEGFGERFEFLGEGSLRTRHESAFLAVPPSTRITPQGESTVEETGICPEFDRIVHRVGGAIECLDDEYGRCVIRTADSRETSAEFKLIGNNIYPSGSSHAVFRGLPKIWECPPDTLPRQVPNKAIEWHSTRSRGWQPYSNECIGDVLIRVLDNDDLRTRMKATILPENFSLDLNPIDDHGGMIEIKGASDCLIGFDPHDGIEGEVKNLDEGTRTQIAIHANNEPPIDLTLRLLWDDEREASIIVPFPAQGTRFVDRDGRSLRSGETIASAQIGGVKAVVTLAGGAGNFSVRGDLRASDLSPESTKILWLSERLQKTDLGRWEIDLRAIRSRVDSLFRATSDQYARLRLDIEPPLDQRHFHINIAPFDLAFKQEEAQGLVLLDNEYGAANTIDHDHFRVEAAPLWDHNAEREPLERYGCGTPEDPYAWKFEPDGRTPGPWIVLGMESAWCRALPILWNIDDMVQESTDIDLATCRLDQVVRIPDRGERIDTFDAFIEALCEKPDDPRWTDVLDYLKAFEDLPPATLDLMDRLILNPEAVITLLLNADEVGFKLIFRLLDQTPFSWHLVPIAAWTITSKRLAESLHEQLKSITRADKHIWLAFQQFFQKAPAHGIFFEVTVEWLKSTIFKDREPACPRLQMVQNPQGEKQLWTFMENEYIELLQRHTQESRWPIGQAITERLNLANRLPAGIGDILREEDRGTKHRLGVVNAPILAAIVSVCGLEISSRESQEIRFLREFDEYWFEQSYAIALLIGIGKALKSEPELLLTRKET
ncbi:STY4851/ECs_5259 family protein [Thioalkalivibrio sp. HK1]|uniref:STY4851/ECs_5259 family protein n=1 Tax=Thioalkalivibrio sp. HK1 TaxID=1469245 RepID=UPI0004B0D88C|nr:STY4851/ECs_5259 family protein [Thioalkalivibrio sp. HK1]